MSSINRVKKLQILYFSRKNKEIKKLKKWRKCFGPESHSYILLKNRLFSWKNLAASTPTLVHCIERETVLLTG